MCQLGDAHVNGSPENPGRFTVKLASPEMDAPGVGADKYGPFKQFIWRALSHLVVDYMMEGKVVPNS
jgi:hypothetical protein